LLGQKRRCTPRGGGGAVACARTRLLLLSTAASQQGPPLCDPATIKAPLAAPLYLFGGTLEARERCVAQNRSSARIFLFWLCLRGVCAFVAREANAETKGVRETMIAVLAAGAWLFGVHRAFCPCSGCKKNTPKQETPTLSLLHNRERMHH
jgi:hypothetical protein